MSPSVVQDIYPGGNLDQSTSTQLQVPYNSNGHVWLPEGTPKICQWIPEFPSFFHQDRCVLFRSKFNTYGDKGNTRQEWLVCNKAVSKKQHGYSKTQVDQAVFPGLGFGKQVSDLFWLSFTREWYDMPGSVVCWGLPPWWGCLQLTIKEYYRVHHSLVLDCGDVWFRCMVFYFPCKPLCQSLR